MYERQFSQGYSSVTSKSTRTFNLLRQPVKTEQSFSRFILFITASLRALLKRLRPKLLVLQNYNHCIGAGESPIRSLWSAARATPPRPQIRQQFSITPNQICCTDMPNHICCTDTSNLICCTYIWNISVVQIYQKYLLYRYIYQTIPVVQIYQTIDFVQIYQAIYPVHTVYQTFPVVQMILNYICCTKVSNDICSTDV